MWWDTVYYAVHPYRQPLPPVANSVTWNAGRNGIDSRKIHPYAKDIASHRLVRWMTRRYKRYWTFRMSPRCAVNSSKIISKNAMSGCARTSSKKWNA